MGLTVELLESGGVMTKSERDKICGALLALMFEVQEITEAVKLDEWIEEQEKRAVPAEEVFKKLGVE